MVKIITPRAGIIKTHKYRASNRASNQGKKSVADGVVNGGNYGVALLDTNENPLGCSKDVHSAIDAVAVNRYPDSTAQILRETIANHHKIEAENIVCSAGSGEILKLLIYAYTNTDDEVLYSEYGFLLYGTAALLAGAKPKMAKERDYTIDTEALLDSITDRTKVICLTNPANPTGTLCPHAEIENFISRVPKHILILLDSAYAEYVQDSTYSAGIEFVKKYNNVVMIRTFSKVYGLAGLRLGWAYCPSDVATVLHTVRNPFNVSTIAQAAGVVAVRDQHFIQQSVEHNNRWKKIMTDTLRQQGLYVTDSHTNFILVRFADEHTAVKIHGALQRFNIFTRLVHAYNLPNYIRITIGKESENMRLLDNIKNMKV